MARKKTTAADWQSLNQKILAGLDLQVEAEALNLQFSDQEPKTDGWIECYPNKSAALNVVSGRYRDLGGNGENLSFWDLCVHLKRFARWQDARDFYAAKSGVAIDTSGKALRDPAEHLAFMPWNPGLVALWCRHKPGVMPEAVQAAGGRLARYRDQYTVIALPIFGPGFTAADPVGWVLWNTTGKELPIFHGKDKKTGKASKPTWEKMKTTGNSEGGLIGQHAIDRLVSPSADPARQIIWKVEGPTDLLALWSIIPLEKRENHLVITNSGGAQQAPLGWMASVFAGRIVVVVPDSDMPGQVGAAKWATWAAKVAGEVRMVNKGNLGEIGQFGFEIAKNHGKDLRDWIAV